MGEINLTHLISKLIKDYEKVHGRTRFEVKKIEDTFIFTKINQKLLDIIKLKRMDIVGKTLSDLPIRKDLAVKLPAIYEKAWEGKERLNFLYPETNKNVLLVIAIRPVLKNGKTDKLIGCIAPIDVKELDGHYLFPS